MNRSVSVYQLPRTSSIRACSTTLYFAKATKSWHDKILLFLIASGSSISLMGMEMEMQIVPLHASTNTGDPHNLSTAPQQSTTESTQLLKNIAIMKGASAARCCGIRLRRAEELGKSNCGRACGVTMKCIVMPILAIVCCPFAEMCNEHGDCPIIEKIHESVDFCPCFTCED